MRDLLRGLFDLALPPLCGRCGSPLATAAALCRACDRELARDPGGAAPPGIDACAAAVVYAGAALDWIHRFKYPGRGLAGLDPAALGVAEALICEAAARAPGPAPQLIVPVPLHPARLRARGFNPAAVLARAVARSRGWASDPVALRRLRDTASQTGLARSARRRNVRGAFGARPGLRPPPHVWLVDDVLTTGSTAAEAARALRRAGARSVTGVFIARTPEPR